MKIKSPVCICNNCDELFIDTNPQNGQKEFEIEEEGMRTLIDHSCPNCNEDGNLMDFEGEITTEYDHTEESIEIWKYVPVHTH